MAWIICFALTLLIIAATGTIFVKQKLSKNKKHINGLNILTATCFVSAILLTYPAFYTMYKGMNADVFRSVVFAFRKAIRLFGADEIYSAVLDTVNTAPENIRDIYVVLVLIVQLVAPLISFGLVLSFFKNLSAYLSYACTYFKDIYVFAEINEKSIALAQDISANNKKAGFVFCDVAEKTPRLSDMVWEARKLGGVIFRKDINAVNLSFHSKRKSITFFAMNNDEMTNVEHSLKIISEYNSREKTNLYLFSTGVESELLLAGKERGCIKVRRIDEVRSLVLNHLYENGHKIFENARILPDGKKQISAVIIGMGKRGTEMLKALSWYCQMDGYDLKINAFEKNSAAEEQFSARCAELMSKDYNGVKIEGEAQYEIKIHAGFDVNKKRFAEEFAKIDDATYIFISLGAEEENIKTAVQLRMLCERNKIKPAIDAVIESSDAKSILETATNNAGQAYNISFVGDRRSFYSERVILESAIEADAFKRHCFYCNGDAEKEEDFWRYEYCYRSSMATAIHAHARIKCGIKGADKKESELSPEEKELIETLEHRRWNAYMRSEGFIYSGSPDRVSRNDLAKMHNNLVDYSELSEEDKRKDSRVASSTEQQSNE